jgi:hypothetical protein
MERCPNCGSTVRAGAKFCTTCGMRLPEAPAADEAAPAASGSGKGSPFDSTASVSGSRWPSSTASGGNSDAVSGYAVSGSGTTAEPAAPETADEEENAESAPAPAEESGPAWASAGSSSGWNWGSQGSGGDTDQDQSVQTETAATDESVESDAATTGQATTADQETASNDTVTAEFDEAPAATSDSATAVEVADIGPTETGVIEETVYQTAEPAVVATASEMPSSQEPAEEPQSADSAAADEQTGAFPATSGSAAAAPLVTSANLDRANHILDELRGLLPQLASAGQPSAGSDIAETLENATASDAQRASFEELRTAVSAAQQRPRDIDTMLDISNRLDVIASLEDAYQELSSAVEAVLSQLSDEA